MFELNRSVSYYFGVTSAKRQCDLPTLMLRSSDSRGGSCLLSIVTYPTAVSTMKHVYSLEETKYGEGGIEFLAQRNHLSRYSMPPFPYFASSTRQWNSNDKKVKSIEIFYFRLHCRNTNFPQSFIRKACK